MSNKVIGVGIIGVQAGRSWGAVAHVPALQSLPGYAVTALSTTRMESAQAAGVAFGVTNCYDNHAALIADPAVDLVAVTVKVPHHFELVQAALAGGKMVFCEWPLGNGLDEARALAAQAKQLGIRCGIGMQARAAPVVAYVKDLIRDNFVGEVLSTTLVGSGLAWGPYTDDTHAYLNDKANGATMLSIPMSHTMDALCECLGELTEVSATMANRRTTSINASTGATLPMTSEDQVAFTGRLEGGAVIAVHYRSGTLRGTNLLWEITGTEGELQVTSYGGHAQMFDLQLSGANGVAKSLSPMTVPARYRWSPLDLPKPAVNVAQAYVRFANDLRDGTRTRPDFDDAVKRHEMVDAIERSAETGQRVTLA
jgi:predicted dehydrogenase